MGAAEAFEKEVVTVLGRGGRATAVRYVRELLAHCVAVSLHVTKPEIDLLRLYHLDTYPDAQEIDDVWATTKANPAFFETVPGIILAAAAAPEGLPKARRLANLILDMCNAAIASDRLVEPLEAAAVGRYSSLLDDSLAALENKQAEDQPQGPDQPSRSNATE
ncbi:MAG: hypothetical protein AB7S39_13225 [Gemmatimonadales bacterium]